MVGSAMRLVLASAIARRNDRSGAELAYRDAAKR